MGNMIEFARPDGGKTKGYLASAGNNRPGIVIIQEWWGLNDQICGVADRFAHAGYNALAPDLYKGRVVSTPDEANHLMSGLNFPDATHQDLRGATQHLKATSGTTSSERDAASQAMWPGNSSTSGTTIAVPRAAAVPHTPLPQAIRTQAGLP